MTTRAWLGGCVLLLLAALGHATLPRYEWHPVTGQPAAMVRVDRWTGRAVWGTVNPLTGNWQPLAAKTEKLISDIDRALAGK
jgi:hypothetical protein